MLSACANCASCICQIAFVAGLAGRAGKRGGVGILAAVLFKGAGLAGDEGALQATLKSTARLKHTFKPKFKLSVFSWAHRLPPCFLLPCDM